MHAPLVLISALAVPITATITQNLELPREASHGFLKTFKSWGDSCPEGSVIPAGQWDDGASWSLRALKMYDSVGVSLKDTTSQCITMSTLGDVQPGWQAAVKRVGLEGLGRLPSGGSISINGAVHWTTGTEIRRTGAYTNPGPSDELGRIKVGVDIEGDKLIWSPCGREQLLTLTIRARVDRGSKAGAGGVAQLGGEVVDGEKPEPVQARVDLAWRQCQ